MLKHNPFNSIETNSTNTFRKNTTSTNSDKPGVLLIEHFSTNIFIVYLFL